MAQGSSIGYINKGDSLLKIKSCFQPSTSTSQSCHNCGKKGYNYTMCKIKETIAIGTYKWLPKEKMDNAKMEKSTFPMVSVFKRLGERTINKSQENGLKVSHAPKEKTEGRKVFYKKSNGSHKTRHRPSTLKKPSSKCQHTYGEEVQSSKRDEDHFDRSVLLKPNQVIDFTSFLIIYK